MIRWAFLFALCLSITLTDSNAQKVIRLSRTTKSNHRSYIYIVEGQRVKCKFTGGVKEVGKISHITETTFDLNGKTFAIDSLQAIGKNKKGAAIILVGGLVIGVALIATGNAHQLSSALILAASEGIIISYFGAYAGTVNLARCKCSLDIINITEVAR